MLTIDNLARLAVPPRGQNGQLNLQLNPTKIVKYVQQQLGLDKGVILPIYRKLHPE